MTKVGFTGTRKGMTISQREQLNTMLALFERKTTNQEQPEFHYGTHEKVRLLADEQAAEIAGAWGFALVPHHARSGQELARDDEEAATCDFMIAAPLHDREEYDPRSGTWATVRRVRKLEKPVIMLARGKR